MFVMKSRKKNRHDGGNYAKYRIGITGTPGTGKKSVAKELSRLTRVDLVSINDLAIEKRFGKWRQGEFEVDVKSLRGKIRTEGRIIYGHLLSDVVPSDELDFVAVLRCSPRILKSRLSKRGYSLEKKRENIEAEVLDIIPMRALQIYGKTKISEFDTTRVRKPGTIAEKILSTIEGRISRSFGKVNWSKSLFTSPRRLGAATLRSTRPLERKG